MPIAKGKSATKKTTGKGILRKAAKKLAEVSAGREALYPVPTSRVCIGEEAINYDQAKEMLGWTEEGDKSPFGNKYDLVHKSKKVRFTNNVKNRPIYKSSLTTILQEILRGRWKFNGEPIILGKTGIVLNGQHTLIGFIQAVDEWREAPDKWPLTTQEPVLEKLVVYGVSEDDEVVNTMDTCKPRSLSDVIYRAAYFRDLRKEEQRVAAKVTDFAVKMLWHRTGIHSNAFAVRQTHSESIAFLEKHVKLLEAVRHVIEEDEEGKLSKLISPGNAAAALYLMATSKSNPQEYFTSDNPGEEFLDFSQWDAACEFFVNLAGGSLPFKPIRDTIGKLMENGLAGRTERWTVLAKAWHLITTKKKLTVDLLYPKFETKEGELHLAETPLFGGVDIGEEGLSFIAEGDPTPEEIEHRASKINGQKKAKRAGAEWAQGDTAWVHAKGEEAFFGKLSGEPYLCTGDNTLRVMIDSADGDWEVNIADLSLSQYEMKA